MTFLFCPFRKLPRLVELDEAPKLGDTYGDDGATYVVCAVNLRAEPPIVLLEECAFVRSS
jgi:hypothetical protein